VARRRRRSLAVVVSLPAPEAVARIDVPTTILAWVDDPGHPLSTAEALTGLLPHATLAVARTPEDVEAWPEILSQDVDRRG
jgi:3-oxoadipate enol-lactonase